MQPLNLFNRKPKSNTPHMHMKQKNKTQTLSNSVVFQKISVENCIPVSSCCRSLLMHQWAAGSSVVVVTSQESSFYYFPEIAVAK